MLSKIIIPISLVLLSISSIVVAAPVPVDGINAIRQQVGLSSLSVSPTLQQAAEAHARYLARYMPINQNSTVSAHEQRQGLPEYTGYLAPERAMHFGYPHSLVLENISLGNVSLEDSVGDLMSAIYHRFTFLDFDVDEIGAATSNTRYVYNLGKSELARACTTQPDEAKLRHMVNCLGKAMPKSSHDQLCANLPAEAKFEPPYRNRCMNGALLKSKFMREVCDDPPKAAVLSGAGRYFDACGDGSRISADWMEKVCDSNDRDIIFQYSGDVYQICSPKIEVHAEWYQAFCDDLPPDTAQNDSGRYYNICANGFKIKSEYYLASESKRLLDQPEAVIWPSNGARDIKPVFYDEDPHPTPDLAFTGYPISVQFNPEKIDSVSISGFTLEKHVGIEGFPWQFVPDIRMISKLTDVNQQFTSHQFAWFPLQRLEWGARYRYTINALVDGISVQYGAEFSVIDFSIPLYDVSSITEITAVDSHFILYREPDALDAYPFRDINLKYKSEIVVRAKVLDSSTVEFKINGESCAPVYLYTRLDEEIEINRCEKRDWRSLF